MRAVLLLVVLGVSSGCDMGPPARSSPELVPAPPLDVDRYLVVDELDDDAAWVVQTDAGYEVHDGSGVIAPPVPGHEMARPHRLRALPGPVVWLCLTDGLARWDRDSWLVFTPADLGGRYDEVDCSGLDARSADDAWLAPGQVFGGGPGEVVLHFDGSGWTHIPVSSRVYELVLTDHYAWWVRGEYRANDSLQVMDTRDPASGWTALDVGEIEDVHRLRPLASSDQVVLEHQFSRPARIFDATGLVRVLEHRGDVVPLSADDFFVLTTNAPSSSDCGTFPDLRPCTTTTHWTQTVVWRWRDEQWAEVAHHTYEYGFASARGLLVDRELRVLIDHRDWTMIP